MKVSRIVANISASEISKASSFYTDILGLDVLTDHGWIITFGNSTTSNVQISFATEGGSGTQVPDLSIEVDDVDEAFLRVKKAGFPIEYGPADEAWGVRRFYTRDPFGKLINILSHRSG